VDTGRVQRRVRTVSTVVYGACTHTNHVHGHVHWAWVHNLAMTALCNSQAIIFLPCGFHLLLSFFLLFSSPNLRGRSLDVYHTSAPGVALVRI